MTTLEAPLPAADTAVVSPPVTPAVAPPGFYADPYGQPGQRYWNGVQWAAPVPTTPQTTGTNGMAVASLVLSLLWLYGVGSLLAVIFGVIARKQTSETGQGGGGLATAGLVIGIVGLALTVLIIAIAASEPTYY